MALTGDLPDRGTLLEPVSPDTVLDELERGIHKVTGLDRDDLHQRRHGSVAAACHRRRKHQRAPRGNDDVLPCQPDLSAEERDQERDHRHCQDASLLAGTREHYIAIKLVQQTSSDLQN